MEVKAKVRPSPARVEKDKDGKDVQIPAFKGAETSVQFNLPGSLAELVKSYSEAVVYAHAKGSIIISLQALMRRMLEAGKNQADIQKAVNEWKPDVKTVVKQSAFEKATGALKSLSAEERAKLLKELQGMK